MNFAVLYLSAKVFCNCFKVQWAVGGMSEKSVNVFSMKSNFSTNSRKLSTVS